MKDFKVNSLPTVGEPNARYYLKVSNSKYIPYITDINGNYLELDTPLAPIPTNISERVYTCGENINSHTPVVLIGNKVYKMNNSDMQHQFNFVGFTKVSGTTNNTVVVETELITLTGWGLTPNTQYLAGPNGTIITTNTIPNTFTKVIGYSQNNNTLLITKEIDSIIKI